MKFSFFDLYHIDRKDIFYLLIWCGENQRQ